MPPGRREADPEGLRRVLRVCAALLALAGVGFSLTGGWGYLVGPVLVAFALGCVLASRDDGTGVWCEKCVARNPDDATTCANCGASLG